MLSIPETAVLIPELYVDEKRRLVARNAIPRTAELGVIIFCPLFYSIKTS